MPTANGGVETLAHGTADLQIEEAAQQGKMPTITGLATVYNSLGMPIQGVDDLRVRVLPGTFSASLGRGDDIRALFDHDPGKILGRRSAGTLRIEDSDRGLRVQIVPPDTTVGRDVIESIRRRDLTGMSIGFIVPEDGSEMLDEEVDGKEVAVREISRMDLLEVSIVTWPVFPDTNVELNSLKMLREHQHERYRLRLARNAETVKRLTATEDVV